VHRSLIDSWRTFIKTPSLLKDISTITCPSLFICGEKDIRPSWPIKQVANLINDAKYIEMKEASHYIWFDKEEELGEILREFIKSCEQF
ncbi:MAG: alpha/beta fold hydrolase, partial [Bacillaceae bacterium]